MRRTLGYVIAVAASCAWAFGVYTVIDGATEKGLAIAGVAAVVLLLLAWARGAFWLPDGGGP